MKALLLPLALALPGLAFAAGPAPTVADAYVRSTNPASGAALMTIHNPGSSDCRLAGASTAAADKAELHTHQNAGGVMTMVPVPGGMTVPAGGDLALVPDGDHLMLTGLKAPLKNGDSVALTLDFGDCGAVEVTAPMDNRRQPAAGGHAMQHGGAGHGGMDHGAMGHGTPPAQP